MREKVYLHVVLEYEPSVKPCCSIASLLAGSGGSSAPPSSTCPTTQAT